MKVRDIRSLNNIHSLKVDDHVWPTAQVAAAYVEGLEGNIIYLPRQPWPDLQAEGPFDQLRLPSTKWLKEEETLEHLNINRAVTMQGQPSTPHRTIIGSRLLVARHTSHSLRHHASSINYPHKLDGILITTFQTSTPNGIAS